MRQALKILVGSAVFAIAGIMALFAATANVSAQMPPDVIKQVKISETHVKGFIAAQADMAKVGEKMQGTPTDRPDPKIQLELEQVAKTHGFKDFNEYDDVAANISMVMAGIDPQTGNYADPVASIKKEIEDVTADKTLQDRDKTQMLTELNDALKQTQPLQFPENVELVKKYRAEIEKVMQ